jgi:Rieske Fe-S protein
MGISRRNVLNLIIGGSFLGWMASVFYPVLSFLRPPKIPEATVNSIKAGVASEFPFNTGKIFKFGRMPVILIKTDIGQFRAYAATCTHLDCIVQFREDTKQIWCACHNGIFDLNGLNVSGPPPKPLEEFGVNIVEDEIIITKQTG